jgi:hypothetical protein
MLCVVAGAAASLAVVASLGGIKPLNAWGVLKKTNTAITSSSSSQDTGVVAPKDKNAMPVLAVFSDVAAVIRLQGQIPAIKFPALWADTEQYFDQPFLFSGRVRTPNSPADLYGQAERSLGPNTHSQIVIVSPEKGRNETEDIVLGFARRDLAKDLIALLAADERHSYSGCFLIYIPADLKYINQYKQTRGFGDQRQVKGEILAYGPDEATLRQALDSRARSSIK